MSTTILAWAPQSWHEHPNPSTGGRHRMLYFNIQRTEKYSIAMWYLWPTIILYHTIALGQTIILLHYNECIQQFVLAAIIRIVGWSSQGNVEHTALIIGTVHWIKPANHLHSIILIITSQPIWDNENTENHVAQKSLLIGHKAAQDSVSVWFDHLCTWYLSGGRVKSQVWSNTSSSILI